MTKDTETLIISVIIIVLILVAGFYLILTELKKTNPFLEFSDGIDLERWLLTSKSELSIIKLKYCSDITCWYEITYSDLSKCAFGINSITGKIFNPSYTQIFNLSKEECFRYG